MLPWLTSPRYEYDGEEYVWPFVDEVRHEYVSVPEAHLDVMRVLLSEFSGICCLGYKLRRDGTICGSVRGNWFQILDHFRGFIDYEMLHMSHACTCTHHSPLHPIASFLHLRY